ncbi:NUDIX domain-containing protein [Actinopolymorpha alba]|uniref:NUDIX domain-containing protein n=1 Tax=Actinopolymorpha alba TaxID=533267 RepID=UPI000369C4A3|nr:NUDIX domain-containing protein [Actinopolymorpha alba]
MGFEDSYLGRLRQRVGHDLLLVPGAQVLVFDDSDRLLLVRRTDTDTWGVIAGSAEEGLSFVGTALAELAEEAGLTATPADLEPFACTSNPADVLTYPNGDRVHAFAMCFAVRRWTGVPRPDGVESKAVAFFGTGAGELPESRHPEVDIALRLWRAYQASGTFQAG